METCRGILNFWQGVKLMSVERLENCAKSTGMSLLLTEMLIYVDDLDLRSYPDSLGGRFLEAS